MPAFHHHHTRKMLLLYFPYLSMGKTVISDVWAVWAKSWLNCSLTIHVYGQKREGAKLPHHNTENTREGRRECVYEGLGILTQICKLRHCILNKRGLS